MTPPDPRIPVALEPTPEDWDALMAALPDVLDRTVDAVGGALRKAFAAPDWPAYIASLNEDEAAVAAKLLQMAGSRMADPE